TVSRSARKGSSTASLVSIGGTEQWVLLLVSLLGLSLDRDGRCQPKSYRRLSRDLQILVAGEGRAGGAGARAHQTADQCALAAARDSPDQCASSRTAPNRDCRAFAFTFDAPCIARRLDGCRHASDVDCSHGDGQQPFAFELPG